MSLRDGPSSQCRQLYLPCDQKAVSVYCNINDGLHRYVKSMRALQKLRDEEWWAETMTGLRPSLQQGRQQQRRLPTGQLSKASEALLGTPLTWISRTRVLACLLEFCRLWRLALHERRILSCWHVAGVKATEK